MRTSLVNRDQAEAWIDSAAQQRATGAEETR
jgi:hypothetical protein